MPAAMDHSAMIQGTDRLSDLPEHILVRILSFLPTRSAARTSILSRRFCGLWETAPILNLDLHALRLTKHEFVNLAKRTILNRNSSSPLIGLRLCLDTILNPNGNGHPRIISYVSSLLVKAHSLGLRGLFVKLNSKILAAVLPLILSLKSLEVLSLQEGYFHELSPSVSINLKRLKSLHINQEGFYDDFINRLVPQLDALEKLHIKTTGDKFLDLKSKTVKKISLVGHIATQILRISAPSLELLELELKMLTLTLQCDWEMPSLKKAVIQLENISEKNVEVVSKMLSTVAHAYQLHLDIHIIECQAKLSPIHTLLSHNASSPKFVKLKHLTLKICYHELNIEDLVTIIRHSPALEVLELVHMHPFCARNDKKKKLWRSMIPQNAQGNYEHAYFDDLHIAEKKEELLRKLTAKLSSKKLKT